MTHVEPMWKSEGGKVYDFGIVSKAKRQFAHWKPHHVEISPFEAVTTAR